MVEPHHKLSKRVKVFRAVKPAINATQVIATQDLDTDVSPVVEDVVNIAV
jgi:hypothetical protein